MGYPRLPSPIPLDTVFNWDGGAVDPFFRAGIGAYLLQEHDNGRVIGDADSKLGATLGGGAEFFTSRSSP
jgi:hypothetical protein